MPSGAWENRAGGTAFSDRGEYAAGPRSQSAASAFLPSRGADPGKTPRCGGRGAEIRGQVVRPPSQTIAPWAQLSSVGPELEREWIANHPFNRLHLQSRGARVEVGMLSFGLIPASRVPGLGYILLGYQI